MVGFDGIMAIIRNKKKWRRRFEKGKVARSSSSYPTLLAHRESDLDLGSICRGIKLAGAT